MHSAPVLPAFRTPADAKGSAQAHVWCGWCETYHSHSASPGHRAAHCGRGESPYKATGYVLDVQGETSHEWIAVPHAIYTGRETLKRVIENATPGLHAALLRPSIGAGVRRHFDKRDGRTRVSVYGDAGAVEPSAPPPPIEMRSFQKRDGRSRISVFGKGWSIDPAAYPTASELQRSTSCRPSIVMGTGSISLLSTLYGVAPGIVGVRLLEAISLETFDSQARSEIAASIEAACARKAAGRDGRA